MMTRGLINGATAAQFLLYCGAIGDGEADDTEALQRFFDELSTADPDSTQIRRGYLPKGRYRVTSPLALRGLGTNVAGIVLECEGHNNNGGGGCEIFYDGPDTDEPVLSIVGLTGSHIRGLCVNAMRKAKYAVHITIDESDASSNNVTVFGCNFFSPRNTPGAACVAFGPNPADIETSDVNSWRFESCSFNGGNDYHANPFAFEADGFLWLQANNTLDVHFKSCVFGALRNGLNNAAGSFPLTVDSCAFGGIARWAAIDNGWASTYIGCYGEQIGGAIAGTLGNVVLIECSFRVISGSKAYPYAIGPSDAIMFSHPSIVFLGGQYSDLRQRRTITGIASGVITVGASEVGGNQLEEALANGQKIWLWADNGYAGMPQGGGNSNIDFTTPKYIRDLTALGGDAFTFRLADSLGGAAISIVYDGSGTRRVQMRPTVISSAVQADGATFEGIADHLTVQGIPAAGNDVNSPYEAPSIATPAAVSCRGVIGGRLSRVSVKDTEANYRCNPRFGPMIVFWPKFTPVKASGVKLNGTSIIEFSAEKLTRVGGPFSAIQSNLIIPARTRLVGVYVVVEQAFAAPGLATCTLNIQEAGGAAGDILESFSLMATGVRGWADSDLGSKLQRANAVQGGYSPVSAASWTIQINGATTGAGFETLTAGKANIYLDMIQLADPVNMVGSFGT